MPSFLLRFSSGKALPDIGNAYTLSHCHLQLICLIALTGMGGIFLFGMFSSFSDAAAGGEEKGRHFLALAANRRRLREPENDCREAENARPGGRSSSNMKSVFVKFLRLSD
jgi:hypothetical protein